MADPAFPLTIDDTSPLVLYHPFADTFTQPQTGQGWNPYYTRSGFASIDSGAGSLISSAIGNGTSLHLTAAEGAALQINWNGVCQSVHSLTLSLRLVPPSLLRCCVRERFTVPVAAARSCAPCVPARPCDVNEAGWRRRHDAGAARRSRAGRRRSARHARAYVSEARRYPRVAFFRAFPSNVGVDCRSGSLCGFPAPSPSVTALFGFLSVVVLPCA